MPLKHINAEVNGLLETPPPLVLPTVYDLLPLCQNNGKMSGIDLKSGPYNLNYSLRFNYI